MSLVLFTDQWYGSVMGDRITSVELGRECSSHPVCEQLLHRVWEWAAREGGGVRPAMYGQPGAGAGQCTTGGSWSFMVFHTKDKMSLLKKQQTCYCNFDPLVNLSYVCNL